MPYSEPICWEARRRCQARRLTSRPRGRRTQRRRLTQRLRRIGAGAGECARSRPVPAESGVIRVRNATGAVDVNRSCRAADEDEDSVVNRHRIARDALHTVAAKNGVPDKTHLAVKAGGIELQGAVRGDTAVADREQAIGPERRDFHDIAMNIKRAKTAVRAVRACADSAIESDLTASTSVANVDDAAVGLNSTAHLDVAVCTGGTDDNFSTRSRCSRIEERQELSTAAHINCHRTRSTNGSRLTAREANVSAFGTAAGRTGSRAGGGNFNLGINRDRARRFDADRSAISERVRPACRDNAGGGEDISIRESYVARRIDRDIATIAARDGVSSKETATGIDSANITQRTDR